MEVSYFVYLLSNLKEYRHYIKAKTLPTVSVKQLKQIYYNLTYPYISYAIFAWAKVKQNHFAQFTFFANTHGKDTESALSHC